MLQSRHIVVVDFPDGKTATVYQGADSVEAAKALQKAVDEGKAQAVVIFHHPAPGQIRYPAQEKATAEERALQAAAAASAEANRKKTEAQNKRDQAKQLAAEAKRLEAEAAAHLDK